MINETVLGHKRKKKQINKKNEKRKLIWNVTWMCIYMKQIYLFKELNFWFRLQYLVDLNMIAVFDETVFDCLLAFAVVLERRCHHIVQYIYHFDVFGKSFVDVALFEKTFARFLQHFGVLHGNISNFHSQLELHRMQFITYLNCLQTFQNIRVFAALNALNHEFITIGWYGNDVFAIFRAITSACSSNYKFQISKLFFSIERI